MSITKAQRKIVRERSGDCCEYCRLPESGGTITFHVDHIIPIKHRGADHNDNLCLACYKCNGHKGYEIAGFDPVGGILTRLYHPREQQWDMHFALIDDMVIAGRTPEGRTTIYVLQMNDAERIENRQLLVELGEYPCKKA